MSEIRKNVFSNKPKFYRINKIILLIFIAFLFVGVSGVFSQNNKDNLKLLDAVQISIKNHPDILIQKQQLNISQGLFQTTRGEFDWRLQSSIGSSQENTPLLNSQITNGISSLQQNRSFYNIGINKLFRSGISVSSGINLTRIEDNINNLSVPKYAEVNVAANVPLLRGRGKTATGATETAYKIYYKAGVRDLYFVTSQKALNTIIAYWNYVAAKKIYDINNESEKRANVLVQETSILIKANERPEADIKQLQANLADKMASGIKADQDLFSAKQNLGLTIGLPVNEIQLLSLPSDNFPELIDENVLEFIDKDIFMKNSLEKRADYLSSLDRQESAKVLLKAAHNLEKTRLSFQIEAGYSGLNEGNKFDYYFTPFNRNISGLNFSGALSWELPTNVQHGFAVQRSSEYQQTMIKSYEIARNIKSSVTVAINDLKSSINRLEKIEEAIALYQITVENEKRKLQQEMSTLIDLILYEDRLTNALLNQVSAQFSYAIALARLRYETGTLLNITNEEVSIEYNNFISIPFKEDYIQ